MLAKYLRVQVEGGIGIILSVLSFLLCLSVLLCDGASAEGSESDSVSL